MAYQSNRAPDINSIEELIKYVDEEFLKIAQEQTQFDFVQLNPQHRAPKRPRAGMLVYADGTDWNPGAGGGVYVFTLGGTWSKL